MADANQIKPGSLSCETPRTTGAPTGAPVGTTHGGGDGSRAVEDAKEMGTELIGAVREGATSFFEEQRNRAASEIASLGGMMANDIEDFARQWPIAFIAAAVGAGFLAGRFLVSSASRPASQTMTSPMPQPASTTGQPIGGARHDFGAVGGPVTGGANAGYGVGGTRETR